MIQPLISVVIPSYNHELFIEKCLSSVLNQTYQNLEIIVIDDGSKDNSCQIIKEIAEANPRKVKFFQQTNVGLIGTLNKSIDLIHGEYVSFLASDDFWLPEKIAKEYAAIMKHPKSAFVFSDCFFAYKDYFSDCRYSSYKKRLKKIPVGIPLQLYDQLLIENIIITTTVLINTFFLRQVGQFDGKLAFEDFDMWIRLSKMGPIIYIDEPLAYYRLHDSNFSKQNQKMIKGSKETLLKHLVENKTFSFIKRGFTLLVFFFFASLSKIRKKLILLRLKREYNKKTGDIDTI
jgi:glycosyltransferase involved in cell wall biosynthesis